MNYVHTQTGTPAAFHDDNHIYDLCGRAVAKLRGSQVYCMAGHYVGDLVDGVILDERPRLREHPGARCGWRKGQRPSRRVSRELVQP